MGSEEGEMRRRAWIKAHNDGHGIFNEETCTSSGAACCAAVTVSSCETSYRMRKAALDLRRSAIAVGEL
jgi:hypothetical protein